jgi:DNA-directed RNA polymerase specialized sigma24 family protein
MGPTEGYMSANDRRIFFAARDSELLGLLREFQAGRRDKAFPVLLKKLRRILRQVEEKVASLLGGSEDVKSEINLALLLVISRYRVEEDTRFVDQNIKDRIYDRLRTGCARGAVRRLHEIPYSALWEEDEEADAARFKHESPPPDGASTRESVEVCLAWAERLGPTKLRLLRAAVHEEDLRQVAVSLGLSYDAARQQLSQARKALRALFEERFREPLVAWQ